MGWLFEPGFFSSAPVQTALVIGGVVAVVSAVVGVFTVLRGQSFAGHSLADVSTAGGSGALLLGLSPLTGFLGAESSERWRWTSSACSACGAATWPPASSSGPPPAWPRCSSTSTRRRSAITGATQQILFGSIFTVDSSTVPVVVGCSVGAIGLVAFIFRPLLAELAEPRGGGGAGRAAPARRARSSWSPSRSPVGLSALAIGAILSTALLIGPAASALAAHPSIRLGPLASAVLLGVAITWLGILLAYDSYYWGSSQPVGCR